MRFNRVMVVAGLVLFGMWLLAGGCASGGSKAGVPQPATPLTSFTQNYVRVDLALEPDRTGQAVLAATFTPVEPGLHVYSKDLPRAGVDGVGRPTLLELPPDAKMQARGSLAADVTPAAEPDNPALMTYPAGPVTLRLPVTLPPLSADGLDDHVSVTYMACDAQGCRMPVMGKVVSVHLPARP